MIYSGSGPGLTFSVLASGLLIVNILLRGDTFRLLRKGKGVTSVNEVCHLFALPLRFQFTTH